MWFKSLASMLFVVAFVECIVGTSGTDPLSNCIDERPKEIQCDPGARWRTFDGTCNNMINPSWGSTNTTLSRLLRAKYADDIGTPRGHGTSPDIPPANKVSLTLFNTELKNTGKGSRSVMFMTFGQFLDHDVTFAPHESSSRCQDTCGTHAAFEYPCIPIKFRKGEIECTPFARSNPVCPQAAGSPGDREQMNALSAFVDGSQIYGITQEQADSLREKDGTGTLKITNKNLLPIEFPYDNDKCKVKGGCSLVGDFRGDENIALHAMHTLWVREHNRIAIELKRRNPAWREERLFQTARKINVAQLQHIVYTEWLPEVVDLEKYTGYKPTVNPSISNAFAAAAFRFGHSLVPNEFAQLDNGFNKKFDSITLRNAFETRVTINENGIEPTLYGLAGNHSNPVDRGFAHAIGRRLLVKPGKSTHRDLIAMTIQRGRDHGIPTYGKWRERCGLPKLSTNKQINRAFRGNMVKPLKELGISIDDLDLFAAGISEKPVKGKLVGDTFGCIIKEQFERLRDGDRYFYETRRVFTRNQLKTIKKASMARILCDNLNGIVSVQKKAFKVPKPARREKAYVGCGNLPSLNLALF